MYRAVTLAALERGFDFSDGEQLAKLVGKIRVELQGERVFLDGRDVTAAIRKFAVTTAIHFAADNPAVRQQLVAWQRIAAAHQDVVTEGRDQGTVVFPDAACKIFLTAAEEERARRRFADLQNRGENISFDEVLANQRLRDHRDKSRQVGALRKAADAIEVSTDGMSPEEVVSELERIVRSQKCLSK